MISDLYNAKILEFAGNIPLTERLAAPQATVTKVSRLCGSKITIDLSLDGDTVSAYGQDVKACALGQCAASIMGAHVVGSSVSELRDLRDTMRAMLKENGPPPTGKWADLAILEAVREYKGRHTSVMLAFEAVVDAIEQIQNPH